MLYWRCLDSIMHTQCMGHWAQSMNADMEIHVKVAAHISIKARMSLIAAVQQTGTFLLAEREGDEKTVLQNNEEKLMVGQSFLLA